MDFALDSTSWDLALKNGDLYFVKDQDDVVQYAQQSLKTFLGEWFLDESIGVPYFDYIFVMNPNPNLVDSIFKTALLNCPGIQEITSLTLSVNSSTRQASIDFTGRGQSGTIDFQTTLGAS